MANPACSEPRQSTTSPAPLRFFSAIRPAPLLPPLAGGVVVSRCGAKSSTAWNPNCAVFPRHGSHFLKKFHAMEPTFAPIVRVPRRTSRRAFPAPRCFHTMEPTFARFPRHGSHKRPRDERTWSSKVKDFALLFAASHDFLAPVGDQRHSGRPRSSVSRTAVGGRFTRKCFSFNVGLLHSSHFPPPPMF